jgi:DNA-nicking Smr family endonuclease
VRRRAHLSEDELALWAHVASSVKPLPGRKMPPLPATPPVLAEVKATGLFTALDSRPAEPPRLKPLVPLERRLRQRVTRGQAPIQGIIDLHGMRQDEAHRALLNFIHRKHHEGASVVIVVTGKGGGGTLETGRGVLRRMVPHWLADPGMRRCVLGYEEAAQHHGGGGALYVRLRRHRETE